MKRDFLLGLVSIISLIIISGCAQPIIYDGTYRGRIIDEDTSDAIEGVVVLGVWKRDSLLWSTDTIDRFCYARETVTDKHGNFSIPGQGVRLQLLSRFYVGLTVFKSGYEYLKLGYDFYEERYEEIGLKKRAKWEENMPIIPLKKLTMEERKRQHVPTPPGETRKENIRRMMNEINKDKIERGLEPYDVGR
jgi:hypothetical protein